MNLEEKIRQWIAEDQLDLAIEILEDALNKRSITGFHEIIGSSFIPLKEGLFGFIDQFYRDATKEIIIKAIYAEMNGFSINTDMWFIQLFGFSECGDTIDTDWLADYEFDNELLLPIPGLEKLQATFQDYLDNERSFTPDPSRGDEEDLEDTRELCEWLIILRLQQACRETKALAKEKKAAWAKIPLFVTAHDYDLVYKT